MSIKERLSPESNRMSEKVLFSWSGGKDSALALYEICKTGKYEISALLTTVTEDYDRVSLQVNLIQNITNLPPIKKSVGSIHSLILLSSFLILLFNNSYQMQLKFNLTGFCFS